MTIYSVILSSLSLAFIISIIIICKKAPLLASFLMIINIIFLFIEVLDPTYFNDLISEGITSDDIEMILFAYSFILFVFCLSLFLIKLLAYLRKANSRVDNKAIFSNQKVIKLNNYSYKKLLEEFNSSNTPMIIIEDIIRINNALKELLKRDSNVLTHNEFDLLISDSDKNEYYNGAYFRLNMQSIIDWFERRVYCYRNGFVCVIKRIDEKSYSSITIGEMNDLNNQINILEQNNKKYGLMLININHILEDNKDSFIEVNEQTIRILLTCKYLMSIRDFFKNQLLEVYKLDVNEFGFLLQNDVSLDFLIKKINVNNNALNNFCYFLGEKKYIINTKVVICKDYVKSDVDSNILDSLIKEMNKIINEQNNASIISFDKTKDTNINIDNIEIKKEIKE